MALRRAENAATGRLVGCGKAKQTRRWKERGCPLGSGPAGDQEGVPDGLDEATAEALRQYIAAEEENAMNSEQMHEPDLEPRKAVATLASAGEEVLSKADELVQRKQLDERAIKIAYDRAQVAYAANDVETAQAMNAIARVITSAIVRHTESDAMRLARRMMNGLNSGSIDWPDVRDELYDAFSKGTEAAEQAAAAAASGLSDPRSPSASHTNSKQSTKEVCTREQFVHELEQLLDESEKYAPSDADLQQLEPADREAAIARRREAQQQVSDLIATADDIPDVI